MEHCRIGLIAAMPEEVIPLLKKIGVFRKETAGKQSFFSFSNGGRNTCLVMSGMGPANAASATRLLIDRCHPEIILNFGFAGALSHELNIGDIVVANRILFIHDRLFSEQHGLSAELVEKYETEANHAAFVTTGKVTAKKELAARLPKGIAKAVVEMETAAVAQVSHRDKIPLVAVRAISDVFDDELGFTLDEFCDSELNLKKWRVLMTVAKKPWIIPQLTRLSRNSRIAANALAEAVSRVISTINNC
jgi:adenosylhomocysteine nucleosidase